MNATDRSRDDHREVELRGPALVVESGAPEMQFRLFLTSELDAAPIESIFIFCDHKGTPSERKPRAAIEQFWHLPTLYESDDVALAPGEFIAPVWTQGRDGETPSNLGEDGGYVVTPNRHRRAVYLRSGDESSGPLSDASPLTTTWKCRRCSASLSLGDSRTTNELSTILDQLALAGLGEITLAGLRYVLEIGSNASEQ